MQARRLARAFAVEMLREADALPDTLPPIEDRYARSNTGIVDVYERPGRKRGWLEEMQERAREADEEQEHDLGDEDDPVDDREDGREEERERNFWSDVDLDLDTQEEFAERLEEIVESDIAAAANDEIRRTYEAAPRVTSWRRVIHPELSRTGSCGLCVVASTNTYGMDDLMPIHERCKCTILPVTKDDDPGLDLSQADLQEIYAEAGSSYARDLLNLKFKVEFHGELGPRLVDSRHHFRGVDDVNSDAGYELAFDWKPFTRDDDKAMWQKQLRRAQDMNEILAEALVDDSKLIDLGRRRGSKVEVADIRKAMEYNRDLIAYARRRIT